MSATNHYICEKGHPLASPLVLDVCPLAFCETPLRETTANGNPKRQPKDTEAEVADR